MAIQHGLTTQPRLRRDTSATYAPRHRVQLHREALRTSHFPGAAASRTTGTHSGLHDPPPVNPKIVENVHAKFSKAHQSLRNAVGATRNLLGYNTPTLERFYVDSFTAL